MFASQPEYDDFISLFEAGRLPKARWTHQAHLAAGLWYVSRLPFAEALDMPQPIQLKDHEKDALLVRRRIIVGALVVLLLSGVLVARMYFLQVIQFDYHSTLSENNRVHVQPIPPSRGLIFDRNGRVIADNRPSFSLTVTRERAGEWREVLDRVVEVLELGAEERGDEVRPDVGEERRHAVGVGGVVVEVGVGGLHLKFRVHPAVPEGRMV